MLFLTLHTFQSKGGIETFNQYFIHALIKNKFIFYSISLHDKQCISKYHHSSCKGNYLKFLWNIIIKLKHSKIIIWGHVNLIPLFILFYPFLKKKRNILIIHGIDVWNPLFRTKLKFCGVKKIDEVWSVSNYTKKKFVENYSFPFEKIHIFPNTIQPKPLQNQNPYPTTNHIKILSILRLQSREKVLSVLRVIEILPELLKKHAIHFYIIGEGQYKTQLIKHVYHKGLEKNVFFLGHIENTAPYLEHCDIFTLVSDTEGFGIVLLEAMQFAKPCIAAKNTGSEDVVKTGESGFLVNPDDSFDLFQKLLLLIENKELSIKMGKKGKEIFESTFTFEHFCDKQKQLLLF